MRAATDPYAHDCHCVTHSGPHWLHLDAMDRWAAWRFLAAAGANMQSLRGYAQMERERFGRLHREMSSRGVHALDPAERQRAMAEAAPSTKAQVRAHYDRLIVTEERRARRLAREHDAAPDKERAGLVAGINDAERALARLRSIADEEVARHLGPDDIRTRLAVIGFLAELESYPLQEARRG